MVQKEIGFFNITTNALSVGLEKHSLDPATAISISWLCPVTSRLCTNTAHARAARAASADWLLL